MKLIICRVLKFDKVSVVSTIVELGKFLERDRASVVLVTSCHDIRDVLLGDRVVQIISKDLLEVIRLDEDSFVAVEHLERGQELVLRTAALVPSKVDDFLEIIPCKARALVVLIVVTGKLLLLLPLADSIETEIVDNALEVAPADEFVAASEVLERVGEVTLHVGWQLVSDSHGCVRDRCNIRTEADAWDFAVVSLYASIRHLSVCLFNLLILISNSNHKFN